MKKIIVIFVLSFFSQVSLASLYDSDRIYHSEKSRFSYLGKILTKNGMSSFSKNGKNINIVIRGKSVNRINNRLSLKQIDDMVIEEREGFFVVDIPSYYGVPSDEKIIVKITDYPLVQLQDSCNKLCLSIMEFLISQKGNKVSDRDIQDIYQSIVFVTGELEKKNYAQIIPTEQEVEQAYKNLHIPDKE